MKRYGITHETKYTYGTTVDLGLHTARLSPIENSRQKLLEHQIDVSPQPAWSVAFHDHFGNSMHHIAIETAHQELIVVQRAIVEVTSPDWTELPSAPAWETVREAMRADAFPAFPDVSEFIYASPLVSFDLAATVFAQESFTPGAPLAQAAYALAKSFKAQFAYVPGATTIRTSVPEIMEGRKGVCQDFAHAMIAGLRGLGLPARYVSGYLKTHGPANAEGITLIGADASHAWVSVWCGLEHGWLEFDPTNALVVTNEHIAVAYGRDFSDVTPLRGVIMGGGEHTLDVAVRVELLNDVAA